MRQKRRFAAARRAEVRKSRSEEERTRKIFDRLLTSALLKFLASWCYDRTSQEHNTGVGDDRPLFS
jgi:transposase